MRRVHQLAGALMLLVFLGSGMYMHLRYNHLHGMPEGERMMFRGSHIYLLLIAAVHAALGRKSPDSPIERIASFFALLAAAFLTAAFFREPATHSFDRPLTRFGLYATFAATILLLISGMVGRKGAA